MNRHRTPPPAGRGPSRDGTDDRFQEGADSTTGHGSVKENLEATARSRPSTLSPSLRSDLIARARTAIQAALGGPDPGSDRGPADPRGAFVTLTLDGDLRGCMGLVEGSSPLPETVARCAVLAATADPRFPPVTRSEMSRILIEISVLGAPHRIDGPDDVVIGRDGVIAGSGAARGLLLPQVASQQRWNAERFLDEACRKAGLGPGAWRGAGVTLHAFEAEVFGEDDPDDEVPPGTS